jgi:MFS transporter, OPA family, glycerol-3-phosphate transporter
VDLILVLATMAVVIGLYFRTNPLNHSRKFMVRRFFNWFPLGMTYAFLYMARYNLNVSKNALGSLMNNEAFGLIFGAGTVVYGFSFLLNGPLVDKFGGKRGMIIACLGSSLANIAMGMVTYLFLKGTLTGNVVLIYSVLYSLNMFFQSYGAVSIIKVKAYWFHVRERGVFGAIFGTLISFGAYFAFDWGQIIVDAATLKTDKQLSGLQNLLRSAFAIDQGTTDATWLVFYIPAIILIFWGLVNALVLKDSPAHANFEDFDTHDASSGEMEQDFTILELLKKIFSNPVILTVACIEFTSGVIRNGVLQWYFIFAKQVPQPGAEFFRDNWGILLAMTGTMGGFLAGWLSDVLFHSRRGPPAGILNAAMFVFAVLMAVTLMSSPFIVGICAIVIFMTGIGVHSIMSGTASADFGGRKATATAMGITDGFVYLGTGLQSVCLGYITTWNWQYWPVFLIPFTLMGVYLATRIWKAIPEATKHYLIHVEKIQIVTVEEVETTPLVSDR